jgi:hypothetical protein
MWVFERIEERMLGGKSPTIVFRLGWNRGANLCARSGVVLR